MHKKWFSFFVFCFLLNGFNLYSDNGQDGMLDIGYSQEPSSSSSIYWFGGLGISTVIALYNLNKIDIPFFDRLPNWLKPVEKQSMELDLKIKKIQSGNLSEAEQRGWEKIKPIVRDNIESNRGICTISLSEIKTYLDQNEKYDGVMLKIAIKECQEDYNLTTNTTGTREQTIHNFGTDWTWKPSGNYKFGSWNSDSRFTQQDTLTREQIEFCKSVGIAYEGRSVSEVLPIMYERGYKPSQYDQDENCSTKFADHPISNNNLQQSSRRPQPAN